MKKRFLCLLLALLMLIPVSLLTGCSSTTTEDELADVTDAASESAETLTMFLITEQHVPTKEEVDALKANKGETSAEYIDAKSTMEAYANVAEALDKITKAKFRTQLITTFYTIEEYVAVEKMMEEEALKKAMKEEAKEALQDFKRDKKKDPNYQGYDDEALEKLFYEENPQYAQDTDAATTTAGATTEAETIIDGYGMEQLKYPNARPNQVDIICVCGYNNYLKYVQNGWLTALDAELEGDSKAILTYVNEKFLKSAMVNGSTYGVPNNTTIGEYTYLLIDKERFDHYEYDYESIPAGSEALSSSAFLEFLKDIQRYDKDYTPLTGELSMTNDLFWTLSYEYESVGTFDSIESLNQDFLYFSKNPDEEDSYRLLTIVPDSAFTYATAKATAFEGTEFESNVKYYTKTSDGYYEFVNVTEPEAGVTYYTLSFTDIVVEEGEDPFEEFEENTIYFQFVKNSPVSYIPVYTFDKNTEYFVVLEAEFDYDEFSIFGSVLPLSATNETEINPALISNLLYKNQALAIKSIKENGYYNPDAIKYDEKTGEYVDVSKYASAIIKGDASLAEKYGDDYYMVVLEYPKASAEELCQNLFAVTSSCKNLSRAMQVITYINTNTEFRNLIQYGIETQNYILEDKIDSITGTPYKAVKRLNNYYSMDIYKTGNAFIAYPEEYMSAKIWDYGKKQNSNAVYNPMIEFNLSEYVSQIDFAMVGYFKKLSEKYEEQINACETREELNKLFTQINTELRNDPYYARDLEHGAVVFSTGTSSGAAEYNKYGLYNHYMNWWVTTDYFVPIQV